MTWFNYLQTQQGQISAAIVIGTVLFAAIILFSIRTNKHEKGRPVRTLVEADRAPWYAEDYKKFLISKINACQNLKQLMAEMIFIDRYPFKNFRQPISRFTINKYYIEILDAYVAKELDLTTEKIELCAN